MWITWQVFRILKSCRIVGWQRRRFGWRRCLPPLGDVITSTQTTKYVGERMDRLHKKLDSHNHGKKWRERGLIDWLSDWLRLGLGPHGPDAPRPKLKGPLCPISIYGSPVTLLKFQMAPRLILLTSSGSKKKEPRYVRLSEPKASHSRIVTRGFSSAPHLLHSGLSSSPRRWRYLLRVLRPVRRPVTALDSSCSSSRWRYSPGWALASATICLQVSRFLALSLHSFIPIFLRSMDTSYSHLILGLPLRLVAYSFPYSIFFWDCGVLHSFYMPKPSYSLEQPWTESY